MKKQILPILLVLAISNVYADKSVNYIYNEKGQVTTSDGPRSDIQDITRYIYNDLGQLQSTTNAVGHVVTSSNFDSYGNPQTIIDENGIISTLSYTEEGWLASITTSNLKTSFAYDAIGQITKVTFPDNSSITYTWDNVRRLISIKNNLNESINYNYDAMGNRIEEITKKDSIITKHLRRQFDELGRIKTLIKANNESYEYTYGVHDKPLTIIDPLGNQESYTYDGLERLTWMYHSATKEWSKYEYDLFDNVIYARDKGATVTKFAYNKTDDMTRENSPMRGTINNEYDEAGNLIKETNARGNIVQYSYDAINRLIRQVYPNKPELNIEYVYDQPVTGFYNIGYLTTVVDISGTTQYNYNDLGLIAQQRVQLKLDDILLGTQQATNYTYDKAGRVLKTDFGTMIVEYTRNAGGQITAIIITKDGENITIANTITYLPFQTSITGMEWGNGLALIRNYDLDSQLTQQKVGDMITNYQYDANGNITQIVDTQFGTINYEYDYFNHLIKEYGSSEITYSYDVIGNRLSKVSDTEQQQISFYMGSILNTNGIYYKKDKVNNIIGYKDSTKSYEYDESNRFSKVIKTENKIQTTLARYIHNAYGERVIKIKEDGCISTFMYNDIGQLIGETQYTATKEKVKEIYWIWLDTLPIAQIEVPFANGVAGKQVVYYIHSDHLDTPRWATNQSQQKVWSWQSDAFGNTLANEDPLDTEVNTTIPLRFAGQYFDEETSFHYNYFRTYIPDLGRYSQSDPIGLNGGWNTFNYVHGNPVNWTDSMGLIKRDSNGSPVFTPYSGYHGKSYYGHPHRPFNSYPVINGYIETDNGTKIPAGKLDSSRDPSPFDPKGDEYDYSTNCMGYTFADGGLIIDEGWGQLIINNDNYQQVTSPQVGDIVIYYDQNGKSIHSAIVTGNVNGQWYATGKGGIQKNISTTTINKGFSGASSHKIYRKN